MIFLQKNMRWGNNLKQCDACSSSSSYYRSRVHQVCIDPMPCVEPCLLVSSVFDRLEGSVLEMHGLRPKHLVWGNEHYTNAQLGK